MALTDNLVSYWKLDEASGNALDAHGANEITDQNTVGSATGKINNGRDFEASNSEYFNHASNTDLQTGDVDWTATAWIYAETISTYPVILHKGWSIGGEWILYCRTDDSNKLWFSVAADANTVKTAAISTATWYFVVAWHDAANNEIGISLNDTATTASYSGGTTAGSGTFELGALTGSGLFWDGIIDEVGWWKRVLTSGERTSLYNSGNGLAYDDFGGGGGGGNPWHYYAQLREQVKPSRWLKSGLIWTPSYAS